jgi:hypothetical protein
MDDGGEVKRGIKAKASTAMAHGWMRRNALGLIQVGGLEGQHATWGPDLHLAALVIEGLDRRDRTVQHCPNSR